MRCGCFLGARVADQKKEHSVVISQKSHSQQVVDSTSPNIAAGNRNSRKNHGRRSRPSSWC